MRSAVPCTRRDVQAVQSHGEGFIPIASHSLSHLLPFLPFQHYDKGWTLRNLRGWNGGPFCCLFAVFLKSSLEQARQESTQEATILPAL